MMKKHTLVSAIAALVAISGVAGAHSTVLGSVETHTNIDGASQKQSGLLNKQELTGGLECSPRVIDSAELQLVDFYSGR